MTAPLPPASLWRACWAAGERIARRGDVSRVLGHSYGTDGWAREYVRWALRGPSNAGSLMEAVAYTDAGGVTWLRLADQVRAGFVHALRVTAGGAR